MPLSDNEKKKVVQRFYSMAGTSKALLGDRNIFNRSEFVEVVMNGSNCEAFIEGKLSTSKVSAVINIGMSKKYMSPVILLQLIQSLSENVLFKGVKTLYTSIHVADTDLEQMLTGIGFNRVADRSVIISNKLPMDGIHISYFK